MKAVVNEDARTVGVHEVPDATLQQPTGALARMTSSEGCGILHATPAERVNLIEACSSGIRLSSRRVG